MACITGFVDTRQNFLTAAPFDPDKICTIVINYDQTRLLCRPLCEFDSRSCGTLSAVSKTESPLAELFVQNKLNYGLCPRARLRNLRCLPCLIYKKIREFLMGDGWWCLRQTLKFSRSIKLALLPHSEIKSLSLPLCPR